MRPYKTEPILKERLWGGQKLKAYNKHFTDEPMGESWETYSEEGKIPVLIKYIDAHDILSVQVHPDDRYAAEIEKEPNGKTEAWFVLDAEEDAHIIYGFNQETDKKKLKEKIDNNTLNDILNIVPVKKGDCIYIPAGTVHALGKGLIIYEIQQPSDLTYRLYDWDRRDAGGSKRALHIEKALDAIRYQTPFHPIKNIYQQIQNHPKDGIIRANIADCEHFTANYICLSENNTHKFIRNTFQSVSILSGSAYIHFEDRDIPMQKGDTWIVPKDYEGDVYIKAAQYTELIETRHIDTNR